MNQNKTTTTTKGQNQVRKTRELPGSCHKPGHPARRVSGQVHPHPNPRSRAPRADQAAALLCQRRGRAASTPSARLLKGTTLEVRFDSPSQATTSLVSSSSHPVSGQELLHHSSLMRNFKKKENPVVLRAAAFPTRPRASEPPSPHRRSRRRFSRLGESGPRGHPPPGVRRGRFSQASCPRSSRQSFPGLREPSRRPASLPERRMAHASADLARQSRRPPSARPRG